MPIPLKANALTTLMAVKAELAIDDNDSDDYLRGKINTVSDRIEKLTNRKLGFAAITDEGQAGEGGVYLQLERMPIVALTSITFDGAAVADTSYEIHDARWGVLYRVGGAWTNTAAMIANIDFDPLPGTERKMYAITYDAGYVLPKDGAPAAVDGANTEDFTFAAEQLVIDTDVGQTIATFGTGDVDASEVCQLINCTAGSGGEQLADFRAEELAGGKVRIEHTANDTTAWLQVSGAAAAILGLDTDKVYGTRTLPWDLENLCTTLVAQAFAVKGDNRNIESEKMLNYQVKYGAGGADAMSAEQMAIIKSHKRVSI